LIIFYTVEIYSATGIIYFLKGEKTISLQVLSAYMM